MVLLLLFIFWNFGEEGFFNTYFCPGCTYEA
jgi:hypothetical protein